MCIRDSYQPDLVILAGFMRVLTAGFTEHYRGRLLNIHPSLLPKFRGLHTHERAIAAGETEHGASIHFVTAELDGGPVIVQARVPVLPTDDPDTLAARVLEQEHRLYPQAIRGFAEGRLKPVSYTHLDVYKRQAFLASRRLGRRRTVVAAVPQCPALAGVKAAT